MSKLRKINNLLKTLIVFSVFLLAIALSYAYFTAQITGSESSTTITVGGGTMTITYDGGSNITMSNMYPRAALWGTKTFTVTGNNTTDLTMYYNLTLEVTTNTFTNGALKYTLTSTNIGSNGTIVPSATMQDIASGISSILLGNGTFTGPTSGNKVHSYTLDFYFPDTGVNQNENHGKTFKAYVKIEEGIIYPYLNEELIKLLSDSVNTGFYNENGYRYEGANPNNYVSFNNETWRIIGVFDSNTHGISDQYLVKIIKSDLLAEQKYWGSSNNWNTAGLKTYLNGDYYNGINETSKNMIEENITWKLGGVSGSLLTSEAFYSSERGTTVYTGRPTTGTGYVGLMYPSDYGYAVLPLYCARTKYLADYDSYQCYSNNWLYKLNYEWFLTPKSSTKSDVYHLGQNGNFTYNGTNMLQLAFRPVVYLQSNIKKLGGDGSSGNPYILGE